MCTFFSLPNKLVGVALIGGALTWINRHGGCARRRNEKRSADFEDYGLADTDFPHNHRSPAMQNVGLNAVTPMMTSVQQTPVSPTIPRLNEQGNFYGGVDPYITQQQQQYYQPKLDQVQSSGVSDYNQQPQQPYYYQPQQQEGLNNIGGAVGGVAGSTTGGYYDEAGYYYEGGNNTQPQHLGHSANPSYDITQQQQQYHLQQPYTDEYNDHSYSSDQSSYPPIGGVGDYHYKPDQVDIKPYQRM